MKQLKSLFKSAFLVGVTGFSFVILLSGCTQHSKPHFVYMPDMAYSPALKAQEPEMKPPVAGTIPQGYFPIPAEMTMEEAGKIYKNPLNATENVLKRGQKVFNTYCIACHGPRGEGDGTIIPRYPRPPSLQSNKIRKYPDGNIFYIISHGQNLMPSYASQIKDPMDRWSIIHYVRALQKSVEAPKE